MTSTNFVSGFGETNKPSSKVLRPPGGGSSDIFGSTDSAATPRAVKNHMASNIFGSTQDAAVKNSGDSARRGQKNIDSYSRLFGDPERPFTPAKNHMKSNIPIGPTGTDRSGNKINSTNGSTASAPPPPEVNGHEKTGKFENGGGDVQNNVTKTDEPQEISLNNPDNSPTTNITPPSTTPTSTLNLSNNDINIIENGQHNQQQQQNEIFSAVNKNQNVNKILPNGGTPEVLVNGDANSPDSPIITTSNATNANANITNNHNSNLNNNNNVIGNNNINQLKPMEINGNMSENTSSINSCSTSPSSAVSPAPSSNISSSSSNNIRMNISARSPRFVSRNPVTGMGIDIQDPRPRRLANRRDGNPVTGEGYKAAGAEINTTIPSLNGAHQVINKNRIPPGGFSSGLW